MTKDEVVKILNDNSQKSVIGWAIEEDDFNEVAEKIVKLCNLQNVSGSFPRCHYCGQFVNPKNDNVKMAVQYGFMGVDYDYYYHIKCARGTERT